jgi:hypothetical protein
MLRERRDAEWAWTRVRAEGLPVLVAVFLAVFVVWLIVYAPTWR